MFFYYFLVLFFFIFSISVSSLSCLCSSSFLLCSWILNSHFCVSFSALQSFWLMLSSSFCVSSLLSLNPYILWSILCQPLLLHFLHLLLHVVTWFPTAGHFLSIFFLLWSARNCSTGNISCTNLFTWGPFINSALKVLVTNIGRALLAFFSLVLMVSIATFPEMSPFFILSSA